MSSETSTESRAGGGAASSDAFQPWQLFTLAGLIGATIVVFMARGQLPSSIIVLSATIFAAALVGVAALRMLMPLTSAPATDAGPEILGGRTRAALEREKTLALRSIKDLEFDHAMGKVSEKDFAEMGARLRERAGRLIRQLDAGVGYRDAIDREIERRIGRAEATVSKQQDGAGTAKLPSAHPKTDATNECASCGTRNDVDARFCKNCGGRLGTTA